MAQMPDSFKPIDMPDSFQPISLGDEPSDLNPITPQLSQIRTELNQIKAQVPQSQPGLLSRTWDAANKPLIDIRSGGLKTASENFAAEHPYIGKPMNFATDVLSSLTSPLSVGLGALTAGGSVAEQLGAKGLATALEVPGKIASGGMVAHGGYNLLRPGSSPEERVGGALEAGLGGLGLRNTRISLERTPEVIPKVVERPSIEVPKVNVDELQPSLPLELTKPVEPPSRTINASLEAPAPTEQTTAIQKLQAALKESKPLNVEQRELYRAERAEKFGKASQVNVQGEEDVPKFFGALKGEHTKVDIQPLRESLNQNDINDLFKTIGESEISTTEQANAFKGLSKLLDGSVPTDYDIAQLGKVFGEDFSNQLQKQAPWTTRRVILELGSIPKALKSAGDFGLPLRQGRNYAYRESWFKSIIPMVKAYGSQAVYDARMSMLKERPLFQKALDDGLAFTDLASKTNREESAVASIIGNAPLVKQSNRAATIFSNEIRMNEYEAQYARYKTAYDSAMKIAKTPDEVAAAKVLNPDNPYVGSKLADRINVASGRGKLPGNLEKIAPELNAFMFSPRLMSARIRSISRILNAANPLSSQRSPERIDALKQLLSIAAAGASESAIVYGIAKSAGYEPHVEFDPRSSDFGKVQIGKTRFDPYGGYQQYITPVFKIGTNSAKTLKSREVYRLGSGYGKSTGLDVAENFMLGKASPIGSLVINHLRGKELSGEPLNYTSLNPGENSITKALTNPFILQDAYEIIKSDPHLLPLLGSDMMGQSVQTYQNEK